MVHRAPVIPPGGYPIDIERDIGALARIIQFRQSTAKFCRTITVEALKAVIPRFRCNLQILSGRMIMNARHRFARHEGMCRCSDQSSGVWRHACHLTVSEWSGKHSGQTDGGFQKDSLEVLSIFCPPAKVAHHFGFSDNPKK
jgi:hypothetical protein